MQVTLNAIDWEQLVAHQSAERYFELAMEDEVELDSVSCYEHMDWGDSAMYYFSLARVLEHLITVADKKTASHLKNGLCKIIAESGHPDEFKMSDASEGCYMLSMSPSTVRKIRGHIDKLDLQHCLELLKENPAPGEDRLMDELDDIFKPLVRQYTAMVYIAASRAYGLMGHCG